MSWLGVTVETYFGAPCIHKLTHNFKLFLITSVSLSYPLSKQMALTFTFLFKKLIWSTLINLLLIWNIIGLFQKLDAHPLKKTWEFQKFWPHFSLGNTEKIKHFFGCKGKEDMGIPKIFNYF